MTHPLPIGMASAGFPCPGRRAAHDIVGQVGIVLKHTIIALRGKLGFRPTEIGRLSHLPRRGLSSLKIFEGDGEIILEQAHVEPPSHAGGPRHIIPSHTDDDAILVLVRAVAL